MIVRKEKCLVFGLFISMVMLQVWVADAQGRKEYSPQVARVGLKMLSDKDVRQRLLSPGTLRPDAAAVKNFVWYNPWTWF
jgi:hypothetical protein